MAVKKIDTDLIVQGYIQPTTIELGNATDTTLSRVSAGVVAIEGSNILTQASIGSTVQAYDADLATVAAINSTTANVIASDGAGWIAKTYAQLKTALGLVKADVGLGNVDNTSDATKNSATATLTNKTLTSPVINTGIELGHATDTTIARVSAGIISVEGVAVPLQSITNTHIAQQIELGHATDTTISRSAAGVIAVEGVVIPSISSTNTLTNKRITKRITTEASSATPTINTDNCDIHKITALAVNITSMTTNLSGTPTDGQMLAIQITGTGARTITWGAGFESSTVTLPSTTIGTNRLDALFIRNTANNTWRCIAVA